MRNVATLAVVTVVGYLAFKLVFGVAGGIIGLLLSLALLALKILLVVGVVYWVLSVLNPDAARKMKQAFRGEQL
jgi:hypothetical protein